MSAVLKPAALRSTAPELQLAPMTPDDIPRVMQIEDDIYPFPWTAGNFSDSLSAGYGCWLYGEGATLIGYAVVMSGAGEAHLLNLSIARAAQRRGLGARLLGALLTAARDAGAGRMLLEVRPSNTAGLALYRKASFAQLGVRKGYYAAHQGREDALVFGLDLVAGAAGAGA